MLAIFFAKFTDYMVNPGIKEKDLYVVKLFLDVFLWRFTLNNSIKLGNASDLLHKIYKNSEFWKIL